MNSESRLTPLDLRLPVSQSELTTLLESAVPIYRETTANELLSVLGEVAPVTITANGPTSGDRVSEAPGFTVRVED